MIKLVGILIALLFAVPSVAAERQMDQLLKIGVNLDLARLKQPGGLCIKANVPQDVAKRVLQLLSTIKTTGLKDELNHSPAFYAVMVDNPLELNRLLKLGYGVSGPLGSLLNAAAYWNSVQTARLLLDRGINPNLQNGAGGTPLLVAVSEGGPDVAALLVRRGARIDARTLHYARACKTMRSLISLYALASLPAMSANYSFQRTPVHRLRSYKRCGVGAAKFRR